jgi:membrane protease YdiL (CAAX protease family)
VIRFFALACALSWLVWAPLALASCGWIDVAPSPYLHLVGALGPALAGFVFASRDGRASLRQLIGRIVHAPPVWVAAAVAAPVAMCLVSAGTLAALGVHVDLSTTGHAAEYPTLGVASYAIANLAFYGFGEEIGWRGYALPRLEQRWGSRRATLFLAIGWAFWHLPLFAFAPGFASMGGLAVVGWLASLVTGAYLMSWLFHRSGGSVLAVALFHATLDVVMSSPTGGPLPSTMGAVVTIAGVAAMIADRPASRPSFARI